MVKGYKSNHKIWEEISRTGCHGIPCYCDSCIAWSNMKYDSKELQEAERYFEDCAWHAKRDWERNKFEKMRYACQAARARIYELEYKIKNKEE